MSNAKELATFVVQSGNHVGVPFLTCSSLQSPRVSSRPVASSSAKNICR